MSNHGLKRNADNEPVCLCGYRPAVLDDPAPIGKHWQAKASILDHAASLNNTPLRSPDAPFVVPDAKYPRAGVRQTADGRWKLSGWDGDQIHHPINEPIFDDRKTAFDYGWVTIGACRQSGTNLNGMAAA